ncbi:hypothetical protein LCGC14_2526450, partial [marine sediment metagenome]
PVRPPWNTDCEFCIQANSMFEEDRRGAEEYMLAHKKCVLCFVLVGESHYSEAVDRLGRCETCRERAVTA